MSKKLLRILGGKKFNRGALWIVALMIGFWSSSKPAELFGPGPVANTKKPDYVLPFEPEQLSVFGLFVECLKKHTGKKKWELKSTHMTRLRQAGICIKYCNYAVQLKAWNTWGDHRNNKTVLQAQKKEKTNKWAIISGQQMSNLGKVKDKDGVRDKILWKRGWQINNQWHSPKSFKKGKRNKIEIRFACFIFLSTGHIKPQCLICLETAIKSVKCHFERIKKVFEQTNPLKPQMRSQKYLYRI